jgi:uncharacterized membrane protein
MNKTAFLHTLDQRLESLAESDRKRSVNYFSEIIDDRVEEGMREEAAVAELESMDDIVERILSEKENPEEGKMEQEPQKIRRFPLWLTVLLLVLGSPLWVPLFLMAISLTTTVYILIWLVLACVYLTGVSLVIGGVAGFFLIPSTAVIYGVPSAVFMAGAGFLCIGLGILLFFPASWLAKWVVKLTKWCTVKLGEMFTAKGVKR